jgi:hypothetical protein
MTMTNLTIEDEEKFIAEQIASARHELEIYEKAARAARWKVDQQKTALATLTQVALDYMSGNGLTECEAFRVKRSFRVDVESIEAVPAEYLRVKTITEINKEKIRQERPDANWYTMTEHLSVEVK